MSKSEQHYESDPLRRTLQKKMEFASKSKGENYCCVHDLLLNIPLDHIILDELHLLLRISDILIDNIVQDAMQWYDKETWSLARKKYTWTSSFRQSIAVVFHSYSWRNADGNADGKGSGTGEWTSLMGYDRKTLLKNLPRKLEPLFQRLW